MAALNERLTLPDREAFDQVTARELNRRWPHLLWEGDPPRLLIDAFNADCHHQTVGDKSWREAEAFLRERSLLWVDIQNAALIAKARADAEGHALEHALQPVVERLDAILTHLREHEPMRSTDGAVVVTTRTTIKELP